MTPEQAEARDRAIARLESAPPTQQPRAEQHARTEPLGLVLRRALCESA